MKICSVGVELFHVNRRTGGQRWRSPVLFLFNIDYSIMFQSTLSSSKRSPSFKFPHQTIYAFLSQACRIPQPAWFSHPNNIWRAVQIMDFITVQLSEACCYFRLLRLKCLLQNSVLTSLCLFLSSFLWETKFQTIQTNRQNQSSVCFNLYVLRQ